MHSGFAPVNFDARIQTESLPVGEIHFEVLSASRHISEFLFVRRASNLRFGGYTAMRRLRESRAHGKILRNTP